MKDRECGKCIKRKTMLCPNSSECYATEDKPYYRETDNDYEIELIEENKQLKEKITLLNKMNEENYEKYCYELKKNKKAREYVNKIPTAVKSVEINKIEEILESSDSNE